MTQKLSETQNVALAGMFVALGVLVPFFSAHMFGIPGNVLLPMHIPVLLCGLICGARYGFICGLLSPVLSSLLTGMPPAYPMLPIMAVELPIYGLVAGLLYKRFRLPLYISLPVGLVAGRVAYGFMFVFLLWLNPELRAAGVFLAVSTGLPGIVIQLILIPVIINALNPQFRGGVKFMFSSKVISEAKEKIQSGEATLVIIQQNKIVLTDNRAGIRGIFDIFNTQREVLKDAIIVDKVIGKAAATLMTLGGVKYIYGFTTSRSAKHLLQTNGVRLKYDKLVDAITKQSGGLCLMEETVLNIDEPQKAYEAIVAKFEELARN
ncbi:MAG: DUF1893 domain-containing protein [Firmicutes bacterium]|nr:DUF1893 domain-containing protein [Bacillota bacterium]